MKFEHVYDYYILIRLIETDFYYDIRDNQHSHVNCRVLISFLSMPSIIVRLLLALLLHCRRYIQRFRMSCNCKHENQTQG